MTSIKSRVFAFAVVLTASSSRGLFGQQIADTSFHPHVARATFDPSQRAPVVAIDEAHRNFHTLGERYAPFAELLRLDGYRVTANTKSFGEHTLDGVAVLVVANARPADERGPADATAFTDDEARSLRRWVEGGGALLLIADHTPYGGSSAALASAFGVEMMKGFTQDSANSVGNPTFLRFSAANGLLGDHPIIRGGNSEERVRFVETFTGQSLTVPAGATALLKLSGTAVDRLPPTAEQSATRAQRLNRLRDSLMGVFGGRSGGGDTTIVLRSQSPLVERGTPRFESAAGRAQGVALTVGKGRVVILGEAALLSAQIIEAPGLQTTRMGMNVPGTDDQQFALNVLHWLSGQLR